jgi:S-DNA-T family DNA segregation ATPase FtsK/SpoIIIE
VAEHKRVSFTVSGLTAAGAMVLGNQILSIASMSYPLAYPLAGLCAVGGIALDLLLKGGKYEKLFRLCGLENKNGQVPIVIKREENDRQKTLVIHLPNGISQKHFEAKQQELEQALNAKIEFGYNKNLILKLTEMSLRNRYPYIFEQCEGPLQLYVGNTHSGKFYLDIEKCPHAIVAGETDSGKSSLLDTITLSLLLSKHNIDLHLIDFQAVTLGKYENCRKVRSYGETPKDFENLLNNMAEENNRRLTLFRSVKNKVYIDKLSAWNTQYPDKTLPYIVVLIDEFTRLAESDYEDILEKFRTRVSMDRKVGIHYITALQRPDVKCISGSIKANMPTRIAFKTVTDSDSEVILDQSGAEKLIEQGRFLAKYCGKLTEVQGLYADPKQIMKILKQNKAYKTIEEKEAEKQQQKRKEQAEADKAKAERDKIKKEFHENHPNPYLKGDML